MINPHLYTINGTYLTKDLNDNVFIQRKLLYKTDVFH